MNWNLKLLFTSDSDPNIDKNFVQVERENTKFVKQWKDRDDYLTKPQMLRQALDQYEALNRNFGTGGNAGYYVWLRYQLNQNDSALKGKLNKVEEFSIKMANQIQFFILKLSRISKSQQFKFLFNSQLSVYKHFLERLFAMSPYLLSDAEEKIINLKSQPAYSAWVKMTESFLAKEKVGGKTITELLADLHSDSKRMRDMSAQGVNLITAKYAEVAENELNAILASKKIDDELRSIPRPDLSRHLADDIDSSVVDAMTKAVSKRFDISHKFYVLKAKLLGVKQLKYYERLVPYGNISQKYTFTQAADLVFKIFNSLDKEFGQILNRYRQKGQFDVFPGIGKRGGAFCADALMVQPSYVLLNFTQKLRDVLTLAHEMGHAINNELMKPLESALDFATHLSVAEVASTFMEDFVLQELLLGSNAEQKLSLLVQKLDNDISTIFRQVAAYNFEKALHHRFRETGYLSKEQIGELFSLHMASYMGPGVEQSSGSENWWVYWSHFRSFFYVYSYASGLLISKSLQARVKQDPTFIKQVKLILSAGSSDSPKNIFQKYAGIDISHPQFWTKGLDEVESLLMETEKLYEEVRGK